MLLANINAEIAMRLPAKRVGVFHKISYKVATVAAAVIFLAVVVTNLFEKDTGRRETDILTAAFIPIPTVIWESDDIAADDMDIAGYTVEIEQIENELTVLQSDGEGLDSENAVTRMEMELIEIESGFWKE
jgi:hypothetical protein